MKRPLNYSVIPIEHTPVGIKQKDYWRVLGMRTAGNFLVLFSLYMVGRVFWDPAIEEVKYAFNRFSQTQYVVEDNTGGGIGGQPVARGKTGGGGGGLAQLLVGGSNVQILAPVDPEFSIVIPKLGANSRVLANVNSADEKSYMDALQHGVGHALGTRLPGENGHVYLFAHSTNTFSNVSRYNAIFYLLYKLEAGDEIDVFYKGARHIYKVKGKQIVEPSEVEYLTRQTDREFLTLQTCWPPGTIAQRLLIFAEK